MRPGLDDVVGRGWIGLDWIGIMIRYSREDRRRDVSASVTLLYRREEVEWGMQTYINIIWSVATEQKRLQQY